ncbi:MAG: DUF115 domain-containing protein, partial [Planctomycetota bacterium]|nr:DUF115 domain-containing protein [Planctomycetota bacterium]
MEEETFQRNIDALRKGCPELAARIAVTDASPAAAVSAARSGLPTLAVQGEAGAHVFLHSRYDPDTEAARFIDQFPMKPLSVFILLGFGLGYHALKIFRRLPRESYMIVIEKDLSTLRAAMESVGMDDMLADPHVIWWVGMNAGDLYEFLRNFVDFYFTTQPVIVAHPACTTAFPGFYDEVRKGLGEFRQAASTMIRTGMILPRRNMENRICNVVHYVEGDGVEQLRDRFKGRPVIVASAGPSLRPGMEAIRKVKGRAIVLAVSTAYKALMNNGIVPDFTAVIDYNRISARYFENIPAGTGCPLICDPKASWEAVSAHAGPKVFFQDAMMSLLIGGTAPKGELDMGATVAHLVFFFAEYTGGDPIIFVGQDLAYPYNITHVPGTAIYDQWLPQVNRFNTYLMKEWESMMRLRPGATKVADVAGKQIYTDELMFSYLRDFDLLCANSGRRCINTSPAGARIRGTEHMRLDEAIERFCRDRLPADIAAYKNRPPEFVSARRAEAHKQLKARLKECGELESLYESALKLLRKA